MAKSNLSTTQKNALEKLQDLTLEDIKEVNKLLCSKFQENVPLIGNIANHLINAGGKRLRPMLCIACAKLCKYDGTRHIALSSCVEMLHSATLLHDDVVDESLYRRGNESANAIWGNKASILVGDFLLSKSFEIMVKDGSLKILDILSNAASIISKGEVMQLTAINEITTCEKTYLKIITSKTAELFASSCQISAVLANKNEKTEEALRNFGLNLGIAFQLIDDMIDYNSSLIEMGKKTGDDFREGKVTLPIILAYESADKKEKQKLKNIFSKKQRTDDEFNETLKIIKEYNGLKLTVKYAEDYAKKAHKALEHFPQSKEKEILNGIIDFCIKRTS